MKKCFAGLILLTSTLAVNTASAALIYVGQWDVYDPAAPSWSGNAPTGPLAYTGQEAAALLFGGSAADYSISTVDNTITNVNYSAWYDVIGHGGAIFAEDYANKYLGEYYGPTSGYSGGVNAAASAFVRDNLSGSGAINYAFRNDAAAVPEPSVLALLLAGALGIAATSRRRIEEAA